MTSKQRTGVTDWVRPGRSRFSGEDIFLNYFCFESYTFRLISEDTIEEGIYTIAQDKLKLEQDVTGKDGEENKAKKKDVARLLKAALGVELKEKQIGDVGKVYTEL